MKASMCRLFSVEIVFCDWNISHSLGVGGTEKHVSNSGVNISLMSEGGQAAEPMLISVST